MEKHRADLEHKHARETERLRDASVRLKDEYEHKIELERLTCIRVLIDLAAKLAGLWSRI